jgi:hypothetical protein
VGRDLRAHLFRTGPSETSENSTQLALAEKEIMQKKKKLKQEMSLKKLKKKC